MKISDFWLENMNIDNIKQREEFHQKSQKN